MNYTDTLNWLFNQLPMYQNKGKAAYKADLFNTIKLAEYLGNPEKDFKSVHVGGTNGKGSTSHLIASVLQEAGYKVGLYTSPHLLDFRERIKINGKVIPKDYVIEFVQKHRPFFEHNALSFFEMTVGLAFEYFADEQVDIAVIEVGMGGRLDSTNIISPEVSVITNIGFDHMQFLGDTLEKIAHEKAGIIKEMTPVIIGETQSETKAVFNHVALAKNAPITFAESFDIFTDYEVGLKGDYQKKNCRTTVCVIHQLRELGYSIPDKSLKEGLINVVKNTGIAGRWQVLKESPSIICDTAHNREGLELVIDQLKRQEYKRLHMVLGFVNDKQVDGFLDLFPSEAEYYFCKASVQRAMPADQLKKIFEKHCLVGSHFSTVELALHSAMKSADPDDLIFVGGSTFVVADALHYFQ